MKKLKGLLFALFFISGNAYAQVSLPVDCGEWIARTDTKKIQYEAYVVGMLNGINNVWSLTSYYKEKTWEKDPFKKITSAQQIFLYLDKYCRDSPLSNVVIGTYQLWTEVGTKNNK